MQEGLPEEVRAAKATQLEELLQQQKEREKELRRIEREKRLQKKYRRLKFVGEAPSLLALVWLSALPLQATDNPCTERQKLTRKIAQCEKKMLKRKVKLEAKKKASDKKLVKLEEEMEALRSDLLYIKVSGC